MKLRYLLAYLNERFPPVNMALFAILFATVYSVAIWKGADQSFGGTELWGALAVISFFFRLRVFDEIKDYRIDMQNHPERVLQSGKINLKTLQWISAVGFIVELTWSAYMGTAALLAYGMVFGYSLLMRYEFFIGSWLKKSLLLYAFSHNLIMPLIIAWIWFAYQAEPGLVLYLLAALSVLAGFSFEIARKLHAPEGERSGVESYSKSIGRKSSIALILLLLALGLAAQCYLLAQIGASLWSYLILSLLYGIVLVAYLRQVQKAREAALRRIELGVSLFMLISYLSILFELWL